MDWLRRQGHDATHLREEGLHRLPNGGIFEKAHAESRVVLTFDLDFSEIAALSPVTGVSVVSFRLRNPISGHVVSRLGAVLTASAEAIDAGCVVSVEDSRHRVRSLPIGGESAAGA